MAKMIELTASDGHKLAAYRADPAGANAAKPRGAIVVIQEIFGVNGHIKSVADGFAADGYLAVAPAMYDRVQRNYDTGYSPDEIQARQLLAKHPQVQGHFYPGAGHGFNCDHRGSYNAEASKQARARTLEFFRKHIG